MPGGNGRRHGGRVNHKTRILIADDDPIVAESLSDYLRAQGHDTATAGDGVEAIGVLDQAVASDSPVGILITDLNMPRMDGMALLREVRRKHPSVIPIVVTGFGKIESAVEAVKLGAVDYLTKPVVHDDLKLAIGKAANQHALVAENQTLRTQLSERFGLANLVGGDYRMQKVYDLIEAVAESRTTVLITGESGTGKTMVARAIHTMSPRKSQPFITFSCGAIPETLLESELFGHVRGAFTGADRDKPGKCLAADRGTLFIDEINSATQVLQVKLLRVLQEKQFEPVGATQTTSVDVRFILATNQSLHEMVAAGTFREDLYYRINVVNIHIPPLRQREGDVPLLAGHFLEKYCREMGKTRKLGEEAMSALRAYGWPGNVRELENAIERAVVLSRSPQITPGDLPEPVLASLRGERMPGLSGPPPLNGDVRTQGYIRVPALVSGWRPTPLDAAMQEPEKQIILAALEANGWNRQQTSDQLGINRTTLYKKIRQYELDRPADF
jgi:DNA-binding NtrC family response regulator